MFFKNLCVLILWIEVALALEGLSHDLDTIWQTSDSNRSVLYIGETYACSWRIPCMFHCISQLGVDFYLVFIILLSLLPPLDLFSSTYIND